MEHDFRRILGIRFFVGHLDELLNHVSRGGLIVVPAAPALVNLNPDHAYREALESSEFAITDSAFLVLLWLIRKGEKLNRISGLKFLRGLLAWAEFRRPGASFWVMPNANEAQANRSWLAQNGIEVPAEDVYIAPEYANGRITDVELIAQIEARRPRFIVVNLGGGVQERLGLFLRETLSYKPAIICTGAAIAFLSGSQASIPVWADTLMLGWFMRCLNAPARFVPRYWKALRLAPIFWRHGHRSVARPALTSVRR
jgi:UDP-N-acetyl-D-mannosaminuronic acid transferase (WecB/TagA/CpsF family)